MILLFTDFGSADIYVGQVKAVLAAQAPAAAVVDLLHEAPAYSPLPSAHLLSALARGFREEDVFLCVVDPGVGGARLGVVLEADGRWFVGPDNGLLSVVAARSKECRYWRVDCRPEAASPTFHGRDVFAPIAAMIARGAFPGDRARPSSGLEVSFGGADLAQIVYLDHYGNAMTGLRAQLARREKRLIVGGNEVRHARIFEDVPLGEPFWYENSIGLVEIAVNQGNAAEQLRLRVGQVVAFDAAE